jgi:tight adherence protein B
MSRGVLRESPDGIAPVRRSAVWGGLLTLPAAFVGLRLAGPVGVLLGAAVAVALPRELARRKTQARQAKLEQQLADAVETCALAVRAGLSIGQSIEFAADESEPPIRPLLRRTLEEQRIGAPFEQALQKFGETIGTEDSRLFVLVVTTHARSGGNLAGALDEVVATIRHRIEVRRELRALSAQGRVSGAILGSLPIAFFLVLAGTSHRELAPVYRSPAGIAMVSAGLVMEAVAYLWIRRLMRVEA